MEEIKRRRWWRLFIPGRPPATLLAVTDVRRNPAQTLTLCHHWKELTVSCCVAVYSFPSSTTRQRFFPLRLSFLFSTNSPFVHPLKPDVAHVFICLRCRLMNELPSAKQSLLTAGHLVRKGSANLPTHKKATKSDSSLAVLEDKSDPPHLLLLLLLARSQSIQPMAVYQMGQPGGSISNLCDSWILHFNPRLIPSEDFFFFSPSGIHLSISVRQQETKRGGGGGR